MCPATKAVVQKGPLPDQSSRVLPIIFYYQIQQRWLFRISSVPHVVSILMCLGVGM